jgi:hypothetical protein
VFSFEILIGAPQVLPPFVDRMAPQDAWLTGWTPEPLKSAPKMSTSVPSGRTAIWLPCM